MINGKNTIVTTIVAVVVSVVVALVFGGGETIREIVTEKPVGALSGPDISSPYLSWGGVKTYQRFAALNTATSTPCSIQSPNATSTLIHTALRITTSSTTATTWNLAKDTTAFATTTAIGRQNIALGSGALGTMFFVGSSSDVSIDSAEILAPNDYIVWGMRGALPADSTKFNGYCSATFQVI